MPLICIYIFFLYGGTERKYLHINGTNSSSFHCILYGLVYLKTSVYSCCSYNFEPSQQLIRGYHAYIYTHTYVFMHACDIEFVFHLRWLPTVS